jgi:hypothetical protein
MTFRVIEVCAWTGRTPLLTTGFSHLDGSIADAVSPPPVASRAFNNWRRVYCSYGIGFPPAVPFTSSIDYLTIIGYFAIKSQAQNGVNFSTRMAEGRANPCMTGSMAIPKIPHCVRNDIRKAALGKTRGFSFRSRSIPLGTSEARRNLRVGQLNLCVLRTTYQIPRSTRNDMKVAMKCHWGFVATITKHPQPPLNPPW